MPLSTQDFQHGVDITGINPVAAADFNQLVDGASAFSDGGSNGKGILLITKDTLLNTPDVPDPVPTPKWKRYIWMRLPFSLASASPSPLIYAWNDLIVSDAVFKKWQPLQTDLTDVNAAIANLTTQVGLANTTANNAYTLATAVNGIATSAQANATTAVNTANNASTVANNALTTANNAAGQLTAVQTGLTNATNTANAASAAATTAQNAVNTFIAAHNVAIVCEQAAVNTSLGAIAVGANVRTINTKIADPNNIVTLTAGKIKFNKAGTYIIDIAIPFVPDVDSGESIKCQGQLVNDADNMVLIVGTSASCIYNGTGGITYHESQHTFIKGVVTVVDNQIVRVNMQASSVKGILGQAVNLGQVERYTIVRIDQIA